MTDENSVQFTATVSETTNQSVTWSIDSSGAGNGAVGTIDSTGLYTSPALMPYRATLTVRATTDLDDTGSSTAK